MHKVNHAGTSDLGLSARPECPSCQAAWYSWFPSWVVVTAVSYATSPSLGAIEAACAAVMDVIVMALGMRVLIGQYPALNLCISNFGLMYLCSLHLFHLCSALNNRAARLFGRNNPLKTPSRTPWEPFDTPSRPRQCPLITHSRPPQHL